MTRCRGCMQKEATRKLNTRDGQVAWLCEDCYKKWTLSSVSTSGKWTLSVRLILILAILLLLSIISCFLPWLKMDAAVVGEVPIKRDIYGYDYIVPLGAPYTAPIAILNIIGFILSAYSFKRIRRIRILNVVAGILILVGVIASFGYTTSVASADVSGKGGSFNAWGDYGMGLEALFGFLLMIVGALLKPKTI